MRRSLLALSTFAMLVVPPAAARASEGDIIVQREPGLDHRELRDLRSDAGVKLVDTLPLERTELVEPKRGTSTAEALAALRADDDVVYAEVDLPVRLLAAPDDFFWSSLWGLENSGQSYEGQAGVLDADVDALEAWETSRGAGVTVAVVDTGIFADHADLAGQIGENPAEAAGAPGVDDDGNGYRDDVHGWDFVSDDAVPQDGNGHGTHVSGTIAATGSNAVGVVGLAPAAKVLALRALDDKGIGSTSQIAAAFDYAGDLGIRVVNASLGSRGYSYTVEKAIAEHPNTLYVVAAGNANADDDSPDRAEFPCALPEANVICVGASDNRDRRAAFSNFGATSVDLFAPGVGIMSTHTKFPYTALSGSSMASPHVAAAAALALAAHPGASAAALRTALLSSTDAKPALAGLSVTGGRLNAAAAIDAVPSQEITSEPTATPTEPPAPAPVATPVPPVATATPAPPAAATLSRFGVKGSLRTRTGKLRVSFSLSRASSVRFTLTRRGARRPLGAWTARGGAGANAYAITRRLPTGRVLKRGDYTLSVGLAAGAAISRSVRVR